jgi:hypothetical protein
MCRGLAIGYDYEEKKFICNGKSSHSETLGDREDYCIKLEAIVDDSFKDGYVIELDEFIEQKHPLITKSGNMTKKLAELVEGWSKKNNTKILRWLLHRQSYRRESGDMDTSACRIGGNSYATNCRISGDSDAFNCIIGGDSSTSNCGIGGNSYTSCCEIGGNSYASNCIISGDSDAFNCIIGGNSDTSACEIGGEYYIGGTIMKKYPHETKLIKEAKDDWNLTLPELMRWCAENPEKVLKIKKEGK